MTATEHVITILNNDPDARVLVVGCELDIGHIADSVPCSEVRRTPNGRFINLVTSERASIRPTPSLVQVEPQAALMGSRFDAVIYRSFSPTFHSDWWRSSVATRMTSSAIKVEL